MRLKILIDCGNSFLKWVLICEFYSIKRTYSISGKLETEIFIKRKKERLLSTRLLESLKKISRVCHSRFTTEQLLSCSKVSVSFLNSETINKQIKKELQAIFNKKNIQQVEVKKTKEINLKSGLSTVFSVERNNPQALGRDRWAAMLGLMPNYIDVEFNEKSVLVISSGTATVIDRLKIKKSFRNKCTIEFIHLGGFIIPGERMMNESLSFLDTKLNGSLRLEPRETQDSIFSGVTLVQTMMLSLGRKGQEVYLCGGGSDLIMRGHKKFRRLFNNKINIIHDPWLTFKGLNILADDYFKTPLF
jgi:pantothenate kinase type III